DEAAGEARTGRRRRGRIAARDTAAPSGVRRASGHGDRGGLIAGAGVVDDLPVTGRRSAARVPALALVVPEVLATSDPVVDVRRVRAERRDEARVRVARARRVGERE